MPTPAVADETDEQEACRRTFSGTLAFKSGSRAGVTERIAYSGAG